MAKETFINNIKLILETLNSENLSSLYRTESPAQKWNNLTEEEVETFVEETFSTLRRSFDGDLIKTLPFNHLNAINNSLNNFNKQFINVKSLQKQQQINQHHNALAQIQSLDNQMRASGLYALVKLSPDIDSKTAVIDSQIENSNQVAADLEKLTEQVRALLDPALAGATSNAFGVRRDTVAKQKWFWFVMILLSGGASVWLTLDVTSFITNLLNEAEKTNENIGLVWFLRLLLLLPAYFFITFSVSQFLRERKYEESYAHKASIAQTLPSYSELVADPAVIDEITASATKVVFTPPDPEKPQKDSKKGITLPELKEISEIVNSVKLPKI